MTQKQIIDAYCKIRTIDNTIPDDVLDFMKDAAIDKLQKEYDNNGWIKINGVEDLPKDEGDYLAISREHKSFKEFFFLPNATEDFWLKHFTHWRPIIRPELPTN